MNILAINLVQQKCRGVFIWHVAFTTQCDKSAPGEKSMFCGETMYDCVFFVPFLSTLME